MNDKQSTVIVSRELCRDILEYLLRGPKGAERVRDELRALLAAPVERQGEPVAWMCFDFEGGYEFTQDPELAEQWEKSLGEKYAECLTPLCRYAQPPAKVVLPERLKMAPYQTVDRGSPNYKAGWNACLGEVAKLNTPK